MFIKILIIAVILVAIVMLALGVRMLFDKNAKFTSHSCVRKDNSEAGEDGTCAICELKHLANCPEDEKK